MGPTYQFKIITPQGVAVEAEVSHARVPVDNGSVGVLANHAPYITASAGGNLILDQKTGEKKSFRVGSGFFSVAQNHAAFLTQSFQADPSAP